MKAGKHFTRNLSGTASVEARGPGPKNSEPYIAMIFWKDNFGRKIIGNDGLAKRGDRC